MAEKMAKILQIRPTDRPVILYCRVCRKNQIDVGWTNHDGTPSRERGVDISKSRCGTCKTPGSLIFLEVQITPEEEPEKWKPACGNPNCDGTCNNALCILPEELIKQTIIKPVIQKKSIKYTAIFIFISGFLIGMIITGLVIKPLLGWMN